MSAYTRGHIVGVLWIVGVGGSLCGFNKWDRNLCHNRWCERSEAKTPWGRNSDPGEVKEGELAASAAAKSYLPFLSRSMLCLAAFVDTLNMNCDGFTVIGGACVSDLIICRLLVGQHDMGVDLWGWFVGIDLVIVDCHFVGAVFPWWLSPYVVCLCLLLIVLCLWCISGVWLAKMVSPNNLMITLWWFFFVCLV